jgi:hypothetical protein
MAGASADVLAELAGLIADSKLDVPIARVDGHNSPMRRGTCHPQVPGVRAPDGLLVSASLGNYRTPAGAFTPSLGLLLLASGARVRNDQGEYFRMR